MVEENSLTSHGNNTGGVILMLLIALLQGGDVIGSKLTGADIHGQFRAAIAQIGGSAVLILNTGLNRNLALFGSALSALVQTQVPAAEVVPGAAPGGPAEAPAGAAGAPAMMTPVPTHNEWQAQNYFGAKGLVDPGRVRDAPGGPVAFNDNMVIFDAQSSAITISLCSVAIISLDDVGMHDNHCAVDLIDDFVLVDAVVLGLASCRVVGNRFRETLTAIRGPRGANVLPPTFLSAVTFGILNATELNQGDYCFLTLGVKKPRVLRHGFIDDLPAYVLDTNRHTLPDPFCAGFLEASIASATD